MEAIGWFAGGEICFFAASRAGRITELLQKPKLLLFWGCKT